MLATKNVHDSFVAFGLRAAQSYNIAVGRYVIMPDHVHLLFVAICISISGNGSKRLSKRSVRAFHQASAMIGSGRKDFLIIFYAVTKAWRKNGNIYGKIPSAPDSLEFGRSGLFREKLC
jgi:hypothetical protein